MGETGHPRSTATEDRSWRRSLDPVIDPVILEAAEEVDPRLLDWALQLSPRERLRACSNAAGALGRFAHAPSAAR